MRQALWLATILAIGPAYAQIDLSGEWAGTFHEDLPHRGGMRLADYTGLPFNEAGWRKGHAWDESARSTFERQCIPHVATYALRGPAIIRFTKIVEPLSGDVQAYTLFGSYGRPRTIFMDGREHPSDLAPHTWGGFSTGRWDGDMLRTTTTHLKEDYIRRNGAMVSDEAKVTSWWIRRGDFLTWINIVHDPLYLSEPLIRATEYRLNVNSLVPAHPCTAVCTAR